MVGGIALYYVFFKNVNIFKFKDGTKKTSIKLISAYDILRSNPTNLNYALKRSDGNP